MTKTKPKSTTKTRVRRTFTSEFKLQAVQLVTEKGFSYAEAARPGGVRMFRKLLTARQFFGIGQGGVRCERG